MVHNYSLWKHLLCDSLFFCFFFHNLREHGMLFQMMLPFTGLFSGLQNCIILFNLIRSKMFYSAYQFKKKTNSVKSLDSRWNLIMTDLMHLIRMNSTYKNLREIRLAFWVMNEMLILMEFFKLEQFPDIRKKWIEFEEVNWTTK